MPLSPSFHLPISFPELHFSTDTHTSAPRYSIYQSKLPFCSMLSIVSLSFDPRFLLSSAPFTGHVPWPSTSVHTLQPYATPPSVHDLHRDLLPAITRALRAARIKSRPGVIAPSP